jgi:AraC-like DNA-binding protein
MRPKLPFEPHLVIKVMELRPGAEWAFRSPGWSFLHVTKGAAYLLDSRMNHDLTTGSVLIVSDRIKSVIRASQLSEATIHYFCLRPERLTGLVTLGEQQFLQQAATQDQLAVRVFAASTPVSQKFKTICENPTGSSVPLRFELVALFIQAFGEELGNHAAKQESATDAKTRLVRLLNELPASDLLDLNFADLVRESRCTPRHLSRIFHQVVGMSFRDKQSQVRLMRAQELLATTESKVVEVALESGYRSLSLFNLLFKRRFGKTPARWRNERRAASRTRRIGTRPALLRA